MRTEKMLSAHD